MSLVGNGFAMPSREYVCLMEQISYAGDIGVLEAWQLLSETDNSVLIDVRTHAEWSYVGVPMLDNLAKEVLLVEWLSYPGMRVHVDFCDLLERELRAKNISADAALFFLCRSGVRSKHAAIEMTSRWQGPCYNVAGGFEGDLDEKLQRGNCNGWKHAGLPWRQY